MLNYIWAGLIVSSFLFALGYDARDIARDQYRNGQRLPVVLVFPEGYDSAARRVPVEIRIEPRQYAGFYRTDQAPAASYPGYLLRSEEGTQLRFQAGAKLPEPLATIAKVSRSRDDELQGRLAEFTAPGREQGTDSLVLASAVVFEPVWFVKLNAIAAAALDFAKTGAEIALGLVGVLALFLGLLKIAEDSGIIYALVKVVRPDPPPDFPRDPPGPSRAGHDRAQPHRQHARAGQRRDAVRHQGDGGAAEAQPSEDTATNSMVMLLAINTARRAARPAGAAAGAARAPDQPAHLPDHHRDGAGPDRRHRRCEAARPAPGLPGVGSQPEPGARRRGSQRLRPPWTPRA